MADDSTIVNAIRTRQCQMRSQIDDRHISLKGVAYDSRVPYPSLLSYLPDPKAPKQPAQMPLSVLFALCGNLDTDILSLLLPDDFAIVRIPEGLDHDEIAPLLRDYLRTKDDAHHPDSEAGREIGPTENTILCGKFAKVAGR